MSISLQEIELLSILSILTITFLLGCKKRDLILSNRSFWSFFLIDKDSSIAIKGIACVFVLIGHYGTWLLNSGQSYGIVTTTITHTTANIALAWFMFFSGYGLSLRSYENVNLLRVWFSRLKKLYIPLFFVCFIALLIYLVLPYKGPEGAISTWYDCLHSLSKDNLNSAVYYTMGFSDWYVMCIIYYVTLLYISIYISRKTKWNRSITLALLLLGYIVVAYFVYGPPEAHYYRYPWAFMFGHLVAVHEKNNKWLNTILLFLFFLTWGLLDRICIASCIIAIISLLVFGLINKKYVFKGKILLFLGGISYFFYLSHGRLGWALMIFSGVEYKSVILWVLVTVVCSFLLNKSYNPIAKLLKL